MSSNHSDGEENLFNVASLLNLDKQLLQGSLAKFIVGFDPKAPLPGLFDDGISKAAPINQLGGKGVDVPVLGGLIHKAGMQDIDVSSVNFSPGSGHVQGGHARGGHGGGVGL